VKQLVSFHRLDDIPHGAVEDKTAALDAHHVERHSQYFATDLVRLCARGEGYEAHSRQLSRELRFALPSTTLAAETPDDIDEQIRYYMRGGAPYCLLVSMPCRPAKSPRASTRMRPPCSRRSTMPVRSSARGSWNVAGRLRTRGAASSGGFVVRRRTHARHRETETGA